MRAGQATQFQIRDAKAARSDPEAMLTHVRSALVRRRPTFGVYVHCAGRGRGRYGVPDRDITLIRVHLDTWPLVGVFGNGEVAPVGPTNFLHTDTGAPAVFPESADPAGPA